MCCRTMHQFSPLRSVWFHPRQTIARIAHENPGYRLFALPVIAGFATWPTVAFFFPDQDVLDGGLFWSALLTFGPLFELFQLFVGAYLIQVTGAWLGGRAGLRSIQAAIAWGNVPIALVAVIAIPLAVTSMILTEGADANLVGDPTLAIVLFGHFLVILQFALVTWSVVILIWGLASVQGYKPIYAILNAALAWLIPCLVIVLIMASVGYSEQLFELFFGGFDELFFVHAN